VGGVLAVGVLNYLPTRLGPGALLLGLACGAEIAALASPEAIADRFRAVLPATRWLLAFAPWVGYSSVRGRPPAASEFDRVWFDYQDRFGLVWGQRLREQFNRSAANAGWPVCLYWQGLRLTPGSAPPDPAAKAAILATLRALMQRFGPKPDDAPGPRTESTPGP
jgi:hypothetical protein